MTTVTPAPRPAAHRHVPPLTRGGGAAAFFPLQPLAVRPPAPGAGERAAPAGRTCWRPDFIQFARLLPLGPFARSFFSTWWVG